MSVNQGVSALFLRPTTSCPAIPQGWTPHVEPGPRQLPKRGAA